MKPGKKRAKLIKISNKYHGHIHGLFGVLAYLVNGKFAGAQGFQFIFAASAFSFIPDLDHFLQNFIYRRNTDYALGFREAWHQRKLKGVIDFVMENHKDNTSTYSHNILVPTALIGTYKWIDTINNPLWGVVLLSSSFHYIYDMIEDLVFFKKLNPNWLFRYHRPRK